MSHVSPDADIAQHTHLGVQLYSVRDDTGAADLGRTLGRLAAMGFTHVEPYRLLDDPDRLASALESTGLAAVTAHANVLSADREALLAAAGRLGIGTVIVPWADPARLGDRAAAEALAADLNEAAWRAADQGIRVGYHNHDFEFTQQAGGVPAYQVLVDALDESVLLELDAHWASVGGADVFELIPRLGSRVRFLHVTNEPPDPEDPVRGTDLTGRMDEVLALSRPFLEMPVVEVVVHERDVFPVLQRNAEFFLRLVRS